MNAYPQVQYGENLLTLAEIARHFDLPESTARYYCKKFAEFMPIHGEGRRRRYGRESLQVVKMIVEQMRSGKNANAVAQTLARHFARTTEAHIQPVPVPVPQASSVPQAQDDAAHASLNSQIAFALLEQQTQAMQSIAQSLSVLAQRQEDMHELTQAANDATEENKHLRKEVSTLKTLLFTAEQLHQDDLSQVRTWMSRLAQKYNEKAYLDVEFPHSDKE